MMRFDVETARQNLWRRRIVLMDSNEHPLHLVERHFLGAAVVKLRRARRGMGRENGSNPRFEPRRGANETSEEEWSS